MLTVAKEFGGLDNRREPNLIGPGLAQDLSNVDLSSRGIRALNGPGAAVATGTGTLVSIYKFEGSWGAALQSTEDRQYREYNGELLWVVSGKAAKRTADGTTIVNLGLVPGQVAVTVAVGAAGALTGDFNYYMTWLTAAGEESAPTPVSATLTLAAERGTIGAPIGFTDGDITNTSTSVINVGHIAMIQVGMFIAGTGIPVGAYVVSKNTGASSFVLSAAATATTANLALRDPQYTQRKFYRSGTGQTSTGLVATLSDVATASVSDNVATTAIGATLATSNYGQWPELDTFCVNADGAMIGAVGTSIYFALAGQITACQLYDGLTANETVVNLEAFSGQVAVMTVAQNYLLLGNDTTVYELVTLPDQQGCAGRNTVGQLRGQLLYVSNDGVVAFNGHTSDVISKEFLSDAFMGAIVRSGARAMVFDDRWYLFHSTGFLIYDPRIPGSPWTKGALVTTQATGVHYNRLDDKLYVAIGSDAKEWAAGSALTWSYRTGDWHGEDEGLEDFYRRGRLLHNGLCTVKRYVDGTLSPAATLSNTRASQGAFDFWVSRRGLRLSLEMGGTGNVVSLFAELGSEARGA